MKNILFICNVIVLILSCSNNDASNIVPVDSPKSFSVLGFCVTAPDNSSNAEYAIVNKTIAQVNFDYMNNNYCYRASKNVDELLSFYTNINTDDRKILDEHFDIEITVKTNTQNECIAFWIVNNINYSLYSKFNNNIYDLSSELMRNKALIK